MEYILQFSPMSFIISQVGKSENRPKIMQEQIFFIYVIQPNSKFKHKFVEDELAKSIDRVV